MLHITVEQESLTSLIILYTMAGGRQFRFVGCEARKLCWYLVYNETLYFHSLNKL